MATIYLLGHGGWSRARGGQAFVFVPKNTTVSLYTEAGKVITDFQTIDIMSGALNALQPTVYQQFFNVPNMTLYPGVFVNERVAAFDAGIRFVMVDRATTMRELLDQHAGNDLHWLACRSHGLYAE